MLMIRKLLPGGAGLSRVLVARAPALSLDWEQRQRSRLETTDAQGRRVGIVLERGQILRDGDVLVAEDGSWLRVQAAPQELIEVTLPPDGAALDLLRAAYHLGNRHV